MVIKPVDIPSTPSTPSDLPSAIKMQLNSIGDKFRVVLSNIWSDVSNDQKSSDFDWYIMSLALALRDTQEQQKRELIIKNFRESNTDFADSLNKLVSDNEISIPEAQAQLITMIHAYVVNSDTNRHLPSIEKVFDLSHTDILVCCMLEKSQLSTWFKVINKVMKLAIKNYSISEILSTARTFYWEGYEQEMAKYILSIIMRDDNLEHSDYKSFLKNPNSTSILDLFVDRKEEDNFIPEDDPLIQFLLEIEKYDRGLCDFLVDSVICSKKSPYWFFISIPWTDFKKLLMLQKWETSPKAIKNNYAEKGKKSKWGKDKLLVYEKLIKTLEEEGSDGFWTDTDLDLDGLVNSEPSDDFYPPGYDDSRWNND